MEQIRVIADKIKTMEIRGAGRIARAAASALRDYALVIETDSLADFNEKMKTAGEILVDTRPTAVSLPNAVRMVLRYKADTIEEARRAIARQAEEFIVRSKNAIKRIGEIGARRLRSGYTVLTHCNSSAALEIIAEAHRTGKNIDVIATESRPRMQGHLTIKHLDKLGIPTSLIVDSAARFFMNEVDIVVVGADAITANGSVINKIGTAPIALAAHEARTNVLVAAETYKFSPNTILGELIEIEERPGWEVLDQDIRESLNNVRVRNPAFDVTPREYVDLIITEVGAIPPEMSYQLIKDYLGWEIGEIR